MHSYSAFEILGPIMIGPSSSHTAGAARLGKIARKIVGEEFDSVTFYLHGSFAKTYRGHGTDRALVAGILGLETDDNRLKYSLEIAADKNIRVNFLEADLGDEHPNTVKIVFHMNNGEENEITGSSIGGGSVVITSINGEKAGFTGALSTLVIKQIDMKGMINKITFILAQNEINIAAMKVSRNEKGKEALVIIESDSIISENVAKELTQIDGIIFVKTINKE